MATNYKCRFCKICNGYGCRGELPGMGGVNDSHNFILNCSAWASLYNRFCSEGKKGLLDEIQISPADIGIAPVTGAVQNIGYEVESDFYLPYFQGAYNQKINICVGDGAPDEKLQFGLKAVQDLNTKAYFFLKPYPNDILFKRIDMIRDSATAIGMDIDAYNIVTMRNQVHLERKTLAQISEIRLYSKLPLMLKGIFTPEDVELCREVKPEIAVISNHGGRVDTLEGSTAEFLEKNIAELKRYCGEVWIDGGIRSKNDIKVAKFLRSDRILIARPFISALCSGGVSKMEYEINKLF